MAVDFSELQFLCQHQLSVRPNTMRVQVGTSAVSTHLSWTLLSCHDQHSLRVLSQTPDIITSGTHLADSALTGSLEDTEHSATLTLGGERDQEAASSQIVSVFVLRPHEKCKVTLSKASRRFRRARKQTARSSSPALCPVLVGLEKVSP